MDKKEQLQFWKNEIERAEEYGFHFDPATVKEIVDAVEEQQKEIKELRKEIDGTQVNFFVEDEAGYKYGSFSEYKHAEEHAQEEADERRIDLYIKKRIEGIAGCVIPD